ncbi:MAG: hypothetical protein EOP07_11520 [Proteobacteria bacterium]|nr:MAG: hypothetical protein EOP07_11520 [Pseudomonadota bacterium]
MKISLALMVTLLAISCSDSKDDKQTTTTAPFSLAASDLAAPSNIQLLNETEVKAAVESADLHANDADSSSEEGGDACFDALLATAFVPTINGTVIRINSRIDASDCIRKQATAAGVTVNAMSAVYSFDVTYDCTGKDLSSLKGKALDADFNAEEFCSNGLKGKVNTRSDLISNYTIQGQAINTSTVSIDATSTASNDLCTVTANGASRGQSNCINISKTISTGTDAEVSYQKLISNNLVWTPSSNNEFYTSGTMTATFNDWNGTITFSGATTPPAYTLTKGGATVTGTVPLESTNLNLRSSFRKSIALQKLNIMKRLAR